MARSKGADPATPAAPAAAAAAPLHAERRRAGEHGRAAEGRLTAEAEHFLTDTARDLWCDAERSSRYHGARVAFFDGLRRLLMFFVFISGSGAAVTAGNLFGNAQVWTVCLGMVAAIAAAVEFAFDLTGKARVHSALRSRFTVLAGEIDPSELDRDRITAWRADLYRIYADEPPVVYYAINAAAHNAVVQVVGASKSQMQRISFLRGVFGHWRTFRATDFPRLDAT
jgi:hypothetical protein